MGSVQFFARLLVSLAGLDHAYPGLGDLRMILFLTSLHHLGAWGGEREISVDCQNNVFCSQGEREDEREGEGEKGRGKGHKS